MTETSGRRLTPRQQLCLGCCWGSLAAAGLRLFLPASQLCHRAHVPGSSPRRLPAAAAAFRPLKTASPPHPSRGTARPGREPSSLLLPSPGAPARGLARPLPASSRAADSASRPAPPRPAPRSPAPAGQPRGWPHRQDPGAPAPAVRGRSGAHRPARPPPPPPLLPPSSPRPPHLERLRLRPGGRVGGRTCGSLAPNPVPGREVRRRRSAAPCIQDCGLGNVFPRTAIPRDFGPRLDSPERAPPKH